MDSITQAALGAAIGEVCLNRYIGKKGMLLGAVIATIPDLDVLLYLLYDKFEMLSIHRGISHSILFSLLASILISFALSRVKWTKMIPCFTLWLFSWLALFTHIILDAFTAYGTQLFLPFSNARFGLDSINVIDPVYTIPLLLGLLGSTITNKRIFNTVGILFSTIYLLSTLVIKDNVESRLIQDLNEHNIDYYELLTMPVGSASLSWYGVSRNDKYIHLKKYSLLDASEKDFMTFPTNEHLLDKLKPMSKDKMIWFAKNFYTVQKSSDTIRVYNLQVDMRGVVKNNSVYAPTKGYFMFIRQKNGEYEFSSGSHE